MQVTELSAEGLKRQFKIVVPAGDLTAKVDERLAEMARTAQLPGFRPGKVPVGLLKKQYGPALFGEAVEQAVNASTCLLYTSPSPRDRTRSRMPSSA